VSKRKSPKYPVSNKQALTLPISNREFSLNQGHLFPFNERTEWQTSGGEPCRNKKGKGQMNVNRDGGSNNKADAELLTSGPLF